MLETKATSTSAGTYGLGLALSGGGAKGFAHVGVLQALEDHGLRPDVLAGTSAGAIVSVLYADGNSPADILDFFDQTSFNSFATFARSRSGLFRLDNFRKALRRRLSATTFEELRIPVYVNATDMNNGRNVYFNSGPILDAVLASCSVPIVFEPVRIGGVDYSDGGLLCNFPVEIIRPLCRKVIGVNLGTIELDAKEELKLMEVAQRTYLFMRRSDVLNVKEKCDLLIEPTRIDRYGMFDTSHTGVIYENGYQAAVQALENYPGGLSLPEK